MIESPSWREYGRAFEFLARIVNHSPDAVMLREFQEMFSTSDDSLDAGRAYQSLASFFASKKDVSTNDLLRDLSVDWTRLFRGISPGYGPPPPYEGIYRDKKGLGATILQEVNQEYSKHGLAVSDVRRDRPDYLGYELDFLRFLCERAALAEANDLKEEEKIYREDFYKFVTEHLSSWVSGFCTQAVEHAQTLFYAAILMLLNDTVSDVSTLVISESK